MSKEEYPEVAYFCMEYGLESDFKIYAGGLGILAGDYLKAARDSNVPVVGIGILWKQGYTQQFIGQDGRPFDSYPIYNYDFLNDTGITVKVKIRDRKVFCKVWEVDTFNNKPLYLLDTDLKENPDPWISGQLYGWFAEERIAQEMVLGIGGVRALRKLGIEPDIYHFNEGHAVFAGLELIREKMMEDNLSFKEAWEEAREEIVFTTHTPVIQGNEKHPHKLLQYMGVYQNLTLEQMAAIGGVPFNMTVAGLRLAYISNGVSQLHSKTANKMWEEIDNCSEIIGITNGVHRGTWVSSEINQIYNDKEKLWNAHLKHKRELIDYVTNKTGKQLSMNSLLIGFARRAVPYKRGTFIFSSMDIIEPLLRQNKIQIIFSGKAHPLDDTGKEIVAEQVAIAERYPGSVIFLQNYDMEIARYMTRGCDLWLNNPRRPKEACGTSGIKAAMNGVLNFSTLDGWWPEGYKEGENGWQLGDGKAEEGFNGDSERMKEQEQNDLDSFYDTMINKILSIYYDDQEKWINMMQQSIKSTIEEFSAHRMLMEYYEKMYKLDEYIIYE